MATTEENVELVKRASFDVFKSGDVDEVDELVTDDYVLHDPTTAEEIRGREGLKSYVETYRTAFPDLDPSIDSVVAEGDLVATHFTVRGTHEGPLPDAPDLEPTGKAVEVVGMEFDRIEDGRLAETWLLVDLLGLLQQLGAIPAEELPTEG